MIFLNIIGSFFRYCWVLPVSCLGLVLIPFVIISGGAVWFRDGVIEAEGGILSFLLSRLLSRFDIDALAIGHVILGQNQDSLNRCRDHEQVHVKQYERWGLFFPLLYLLFSAVALARGLDPYRDNRFEQEAFRSSGPNSSASSTKPSCPVGT